MCIRDRANKTPGTEDIVPRVFTGDHGMTLVEQAPFGVIGSITPSTNPPGTVINNSISMIAAGNAVVFNPHPSATKCSQETMRILNEAIVAAGGPMGLICCPTKPNMDTLSLIHILRTAPSPLKLMVALENSPPMTNRWTVLEVERKIGRAHV